MTSMTGLDLIARSLRLLNVIGEGVTPSAAMAQDAFADLSDMLEAWRKKRLTIRLIQRHEVALVAGTDRYPLDVRFDWVEGAAYEFVAAPGREYPLEVYTHDSYRKHSAKGVPTQVPDGVYIDKRRHFEDRYTEIVVVPMPSATGTIKIFVYAARPDIIFADFSTTVYVLPEGWPRAVRYGLARELKNRYPGTWSPELEAAYIEAMADVQRGNEIIAELKADPFLLGGSVTSRSSGLA